METELKRTYLVQRLNVPYPDFDNPFSFGGGLKNGGLSDAAMKLLRPVFSFDYMGSSEFELGAIPECFQYMAENIKEYSTHELTIYKTPVYVICKADCVKLINERINKLAKEKIVCKHWTGFNNALGLNKYLNKEDCPTIGWLELDNKFMFFVNKDAADKTAQILGL